MARADQRKEREWDLRARPFLATEQQRERADVSKRHRKEGTRLDREHGPPTQPRLRTHCSPKFLATGMIRCHLSLNTMAPTSQAHAVCALGGWSNVQLVLCTYAQKPCAKKISIFKITS
mmetsp:Transcript_39855/g.93433  ORF Transcript_39855/g.93433 Transcript_39855/m.93433 type:complete len:119 (+) Transcript_39855:1162-1518(+)